MAQTLASHYSLSWPTTLVPSSGSALTPLESFVEEHILPSLPDLNRPSKVLEFPGLLWGASKRRGVLSAPVAGDYRIYSRNGRVVGGRDEFRTSLTSDLAERLLVFKSTVRTTMQSAGLQVPEGRLFASNEREAALAYAVDAGFPVAVKPNCRTAGRGVSRGVGTAEHFAAAWDSSISALSYGDPPRPWDRQDALKESSDQVLVERDDQGLGLRVFVAGENAPTALIRVPMFVIGDGSSTAIDLWGALQEWRSQNIFLRRMNQPRDVILRRMDRLGVDPNSVPERGRLVVLQDRPSVHGGGLSMDVTRLISSQIREMAVEARWAIPGMLAGGIDISLQAVNSSEGTVVGANDRASQQLHSYPAFGRSRDVTESIIDLFLRSG